MVKIHVKIHVGMRNKFNHKSKLRLIQMTSRLQRFVSIPPNLMKGELCSEAGLL